MLAAAGTANLSAGHADEANAKSLLKAMSDYLAAQKAMSFDYDSNLEIVSTQQQKIGLASSGTVTLNRPDKLRATRTGGFANIEMVFDGKPLTKNGLPRRDGETAQIFEAPREQLTQQYVRREFS